LKSYKIFEMQTSVDVDTDYSIIKSNNDFMQQISEIRRKATSEEIEEIQTQINSIS